MTIFFGISGFLITTLLLREEDRHDRVSLKNFYIRRAFRIAPLYFLALALTTALVLGFGLGEGGDNFLDRLPLLATFNGEFAGSGTFSHSWSLGIEEKFYIVWPLLAFGIPLLRRHIGWILLLLVPLTAIASFVPWTGYLGIYMTILGGCALAVAMHYRNSFRVVRVLASPWLSTIFFAGMIVFILFGTDFPIQDVSRYAHVVFGVLALLALPGVLVRDGWQQRLLSLRFIVFYGGLAYGIYLFHPFVGDVIDRIIEPGQTSPLLVTARFLTMISASFAFALILKATVETPFIRMGRRMTSPAPAPATVEADPTTGDETNKG